MKKIIEDNFSVFANAEILYEQPAVPIFQNKLFSNIEEAIATPKASVKLVKSGISSFVFNAAFSQDLMVYDESYQNEQGFSSFFKEHLNSVKHLLLQKGIKNKLVYEIGCGKGLFFEMLLNSGIDIYGFDPTYEGINERIKKEYFTFENAAKSADVLILRHVLEHIKNPFSFLHEIAEINNYQGFIYIEVPAFEWIVSKNAFWDIFYEHCNYFTISTLSSMFDKAETGYLFGNQYLYLWGRLDSLKSKITNFEETHDIRFSESLSKYKSHLRQSGKKIIWGAGAKGSTFLNLLDPHRIFIDYVVDINIAKQNRYIAGTGHEVRSPSSVFNDKDLSSVIIMNENYADEIKIELSTLKINYLTI